ncbi:MAG: IS66 family transposase [Bdellovibrio sp.]|nr:IS66 family transposase [Bdellovibrio sp.]
MKNLRYDFDKETDKDFLKEAGKMLQERVIHLELENLQLKLEKTQDEEIKTKLTGELLVLRRRVFDSKQEKKEKLKDLKKEKRKNKANLLHNQNENKKDLEGSNTGEIELSVEEIEHDLSHSQCPHCSNTELNELKGLFEESTEYDVNATYYLLKRHKRKKYKCNHCQKIITAKGPEKLKAGAQFSVQMAVQIACDKFQYHLPLERQRIKMKNAGLEVSVKTLFSLTGHLYQLLLPLEELNKQDIFTGEYACMDESPLNFFNPQKSRGYAWTVSNHIGAYYQFEPTRSGDVAKEMIRGFQGIVVTDGYGSYGFLGDQEGILHAYCWSHVRRYFFDAMGEDKRAGAVVDLIDRLYEIEHQAASYEDLKYLREKYSQAIYNDIEAWVNENEAHYLDSTLTGKAINYFYNQKDGLVHFLTNEKVPLDNNMAERRQRCPVMGKRNYLAFRSIDGADIGMFFYSIIESCKTNGLEPSAYLQEMALRSIRKEELETPYRYASRLKEEIGRKLIEQLSGGASP